MSHHSNIIDFNDFTKVRMHAGTIITAIMNHKARKPAYVLEIDFGDLGIKTSSAQITEHYSPDDLIGCQIIAVMNFMPKNIAGITSEVLVLACVSKENGTILLHPSKQVPNGSPVL
ncbi:tRNA-binding protein [Candidatus Berkiella aquae]|uniref:Methionine--tRNA ligase n=1 Tax=Candidatus Berkiella aquae TaxID=295108 RepID=A0A0Q9Y985_9GAMM|nr:tRNA-binding protein [Candidatus Berkiella aquae]MCS5709966.1 tRNA-binding protein [Candidatus Berkiella aquae]